MALKLQGQAGAHPRLLSKSLHEALSPRSGPGMPDHQVVNCADIDYTVLQLSVCILQCDRLLAGMLVDFEGS